jgi:hypothetical protein
MSKRERCRVGESDCERVSETRTRACDGERERERERERECVSVRVSAREGGKSKEMNIDGTAMGKE